MHMAQAGLAGAGFSGLPDFPSVLSFSFISPETHPVFEAHSGALFCSEGAVFSA